MRSFISARMIAERLCSPSRAGQELLPHLVDKLITASIPSSSIREQRFPRGDEIYLHGPDGVLAVDDELQHQFVPNGLSIWEMGTSKDPKSKADEDFATAEVKLANAFPNITPAVPAERATFVFVTSKPWEAAKWIAEKRRGSTWKSIRVLDAVALEKWIEQRPAVMLWFADVCGLPAAGLFDAKQYLRQLGVSFGVDLSPELAIAGREEELSQLRDSIFQTRGEAHIYGESVEAAAAFLAASALVNPDKSIEDMPLVFADAQANLKLLATSRAKLILVPLGPEALAEAKNTGASEWRLVIPEIAGSRPSDQSQKLTLGRFKRTFVEEYLVEAMNIEEHRARHMVRDSKGSLIALLWLLSSGPIGVPRWAKGKDATTHASLLLAGSWIGSNADDTTVIERLSRKDYRDVEALLQSSLVPEGPWIHHGVEWLCVSREFVWAQLVERMTETMLSDLQEVVLEVVGEPDPSLDLPQSERYMANILGKVRKFSNSLRKGLVDSVARLAVVREDGQARADRIVHDLFKTGNQGELSRWLSLTDVLSELAEAAPGVFLDSLEGILRTDAAGFFKDGRDTDAIFDPTSAHIYLLWALERLAWQKEYFPRVLRLLVMLAESDPGGKTSYGPKSCLVTILLPWSPQHSESLENAASALDMLYQTSSAVVWDVAAKLLPTMHAISSPTQTPFYRSHEGKRQVSNKEYWEFIRAVVEKMIGWASGHPSRLARLVKAYPELRRGYPEIGNLVTGTLDQLDASKLTDAEKATVHDALREVIAHHRQYNETAWALAESDIGLLDEIRRKYQPSDNVRRYQHLFSWDPDVPDAPMQPYEDGWDEWLGGKQEAAIAAIHEQSGVAGLIRLAQECVLPHTVGAAVGSVGILSQEEASGLIQETLSGDPADYGRDPTMQLGRGYVWSKCRDADATALHESLGSLDVAWTPAIHANVALSVPATRDLWDRVKTLGVEVDRYYWKNVEVRRRSREHWQLVLSKLLDVERPWSAIEVIADVVDERHEGEPIDKPASDRVLEVMEQALGSDEEVEPLRRKGQMMSYFIEQVFVYLDVQNADPVRLARLEWGFLRVLEHTKRGVRALQQQVISSPELFVEMLKVLFRANGEQPAEEPTAEQREMAEHAFHLLEGIHTIPGCRTTDTEETVDGTALHDWVFEARRLAEEADRVEVCDSQIGQLLSHSPESPDGSWPCVEARELIEEVQSARIENGIRIGVYNQRGAIFRAKGGKQEWELTEKYRALAEKSRIKWPRTAAFLDELANGYEKEARAWDEKAKWEEYR